MITQDEIKAIFVDIDRKSAARIEPHEWTRRDMVANDEQGRTERQLVLIADKLVADGVWKQRDAINDAGRRCVVYSRAENV